jgi:translation initiation factor IF-2
VLQGITGVIGLEESLVDLIAQQLSSAQSPPATNVVKHEVRQLIKTENRIADVLDQLAHQGLSSDSVFQDDVTRFMKLEDSLDALLAKT